MWIIIGPMQYWSKGRSNTARILFANHCEPQCLLKWPEEPLKWTKYKCNIHTVPSPAGISWTSLFVRSCNSQISHPLCGIPTPRRDYLKLVVIGQDSELCWPTSPAPWTSVTCARKGLMPTTLCGKEVAGHQNGIFSEKTMEKLWKNYMET